MSRAAALIATWFGAGKAPKAPGTFGSLATLPFAYVLHVTLGAYAVLAFSLLAFALGCWASAAHAKAIGKEDPGEIVIDEVAGQSLLLAFLPPTLLAYAVGFLLFRLFDVLKPWPVSLADRKLEGGFGIMADDMLAGFYPVALFMIVALLSPYTGGPEDVLQLLHLWLNQP